ncbi:MAG: hypothetical protein GY722_14525 [bacterium]|nr:hypothetical protein [bacterium]
MGNLRDQMEADLKIGGYSASTRKIYLLYARLFAKYHMRSPKVMREREIRQFLLHMIEERMSSRSTVRQVRAALTFLYTTTLHRPIDVEWIPVPKRRLPRLPGSLTPFPKKPGGDHVRFLPSISPAASRSPPRSSSTSAGRMRR